MRSAHDLDNDVVFLKVVNVEDMGFVFQTQ